MTGRTMGPAVSLTKTSKTTQVSHVARPPGGIGPAGSLPDGRVARVGHEQGPAPIEG